MVDVCFGVLLELLRRDKVSAAYLAEKFEVSQRTVYRYVDVLSAHGIPVFCERGRHGGIKLADNCRLPSAYLTEEEKSDIFSALNLLEAATPSDKIDLIRAKLNALYSAKREDSLFVGNDRLVVDGGILNNEAQYKDKIEPLKKAVDNCLTVKLVYHDRSGEVSEREVEPIAFILKNLVWYIFGFCRLRGDMRTFKISRIEKLILTDNTFVRRDINDFPSWKLDFNDDFKTVNLLLGVKNEARYDVEEWLGIECVSPSKNRDFPFTASAAVKLDTNLVPRLLSFCDKIKILSPSSLRDAVVSASVAICSSYSD